MSEINAKDELFNEKCVVIEKSKYRRSTKRNNKTENMFHGRIIKYKAWMSIIEKINCNGD